MNNVIIDLDRPRPLHFGPVAFSEFEKTSGESIGEVLVRLAQNPVGRYSYDLVSHLLAAGLRRGDPTITPAGACALIEQAEEKGAADIDAIWTKLDEAMAQTGLLKVLAREAAKAATPPAPPALPIEE